MKTKTDLKYQLVRIVVKKPTGYSMDFQKMSKLKCLLPTVIGVHTLQCLETNLVLSGW
jgi:hypothetical protein